MLKPRLHGHPASRNPRQCSRPDIDDGLRSCRLSCTCGIWPALL